MASARVVPLGWGSADSPYVWVRFDGAGRVRDKEWQDQPCPPFWTRLRRWLHR